MLLKSTTALAAVIAFGGAALLSVAPANAASRVQATGMATSGKLVPYVIKKARAERAAIQNWNTRVTRIYGARFANWNRATGKATSCSRNTLTRVHCTVSAVPHPVRYGYR